MSLLFIRLSNEDNGCHVEHGVNMHCSILHKESNWVRKYRTKNYVIGILGITSWLNRKVIEDF